MPIIPPAPKVQTVELTGKNLKAQLVWAWVLAISSIIAGVILARRNPQLGQWVFWGGFGVAIAWELTTRARIWWEHK